MTSAREVIAEALYDEPMTSCEECNGIGSDENCHFWCSTCKGQGWIVDPEQEAVAREMAEIDADAALAALAEAGFTVARLEQVGWWSPHASDPVNVGGMYDGKLDDDDEPVFRILPEEGASP